MALTHGAELKKVGLIEQDDHGDGRMPAAALLVAQPEALEGRLLPRIEAVEVRALPRQLGVEAGHHVHPHVARRVEEARMAMPGVQAEGVVHPHRVATHGLHQPQVAAARSSPLPRVASLHHVLRGQPALQAARPLTRQGSVGNAAHRPERRHRPRGDVGRLPRRPHSRSPRGGRGWRCGGSELSSRGRGQSGRGWADLCCYGSGSWGSCCGHWT
mmetsp:Transcript_83057/g.220359  ORF Transcript_83057/g.220359 Transcript_83057/m.220359 type:complete len:215 (+) Transcript_83057:1202-1846(+)